MTSTETDTTAPHASAPNASPPEASETLDHRGLEPPMPMVRTLQAYERLTPGASLTIRNDRVPFHLFPQLEERGARYAVDVLEDGGARVTIRKPAAAYPLHPGVLTVVHAVTVGFGASVLLGAVHPLVPVLLGVPLARPRWSGPAWAIFTAGALALLAGFWTSSWCSSRPGRRTGSGRKGASRSAGTTETRARRCRTPERGRPSGTPPGREPEQRAGSRSGTRRTPALRPAQRRRAHDPVGGSVRTGFGHERLEPRRAGRGRGSVRQGTEPVGVGAP